MAAKGEPANVVVVDETKPEETAEGEEGAEGSEASPAVPRVGDDGEEVKEEEVFVGEPRTMQQKAAAHNINCVNYQVDEVIDIMKENVNKVLERDEKLGEMEERAEILYEGAQRFQQSAGSLKNKAMWANMKQTIIMVVAGLVLLLIGAKYMGFI